MCFDRYLVIRNQFSSICNSFWRVTYGSTRAIVELLNSANKNYKSANRSALSVSTRPEIFGKRLAVSAKSALAFRSRAFSLLPRDNFVKCAKWWRQCVLFSVAKISLALSLSLRSRCHTAHARGCFFICADFRALPSDHLHHYLSSPLRAPPSKLRAYPSRLALRPCFFNYEG